MYLCPHRARPGNIKIRTEVNLVDAVRNEVKKSTARNGRPTGAEGTDFIEGASDQITLLGTGCDCL